MAKNKKNFLLENLEIIDISSEGKAVGRHEGLVVFAEGAVPGDIADIMVHKKKSSFAEGRVERIVKNSPDRVQPVCEHFGTCGGCKWQNLDYKAQLRFKQKYVQDAFSRIGKFPFPELEPILGNATEYYYRNKLEYTFSAKKWLTSGEMATAETISSREGLGFHVPGLFDKVLDVKNCYLQPSPSNEIRNAVKAYALEKHLSFYDIRNKAGMLRTLLIRTTSIGEVMVLVAVFEYQEKELFDLLEYLKNNFPAITSLQYVHNPKGNDTLNDLQVQVFHGKDHITEEMEGLRFKISPKSFYQTNSAQAYELYKLTREIAGLTGTEIVYDLYTGTGTIANFVARQCAKVVGIEYVEDAILDARVNSRENNIGNTVFFSGDMKDVLNPAFIAEHGQPDVIITDPPRAGMHEDVVKVILQAAPKKVVYVSCNPSTQARDIALLQEKYEVKRSKAVDMFPQTAHVENVTLLELR